MAKKQPTLTPQSARFAKFKNYPKVLTFIERSEIKRPLYRIKWQGKFVEGYQGKYLFDSPGKARLSFKRAIDWTARDVFKELGELDTSNHYHHRMSPAQLNEYVDYLIASGELEFEEAKFA